MINKTKIDWCDYTFNPVWGCRNNCDYCYARRLNERFHFIDDYSIPTWIESNFQKEFPKTPSKIFVGSVSDIWFWENLWLTVVLNKIKEYPQHIFIFLTKFPFIYREIEFPLNCWLGVSDEGHGSYPISTVYNMIPNIKFVSFEPLLTPIVLASQDNYLKWVDFDWIIVGAETGNRKGKITPKNYWIKEIRDYCLVRNIPLFEKESLKPIMKKLIQEFPELLK